MRWVAVSVIVGGMVVSGCGDDDVDLSARLAPGGERSPASWARLPDPPLSPRNGALAAWTGDEVVVVGGWESLCPPNARCAGSDDPPFADGAAFDPDVGTWRPIASAPTPFANVNAAVVGGAVYVLGSCATPAWALGDVVVVNPHFGRAAGGGIFIPATSTWDDLPSPPNAASWGGDMAGALGRDSAVYEYAAGWVLDVSTQTWHEIPPIDDRANSAVTAAGRDLFVFGGDRWTHQGGGTLLSDA